MIVRLLLLSGFLLSPFLVHAQALSGSPYSAFGIGELYYTSGSRNAAMGGIGIGTSDHSSVNRLNPASFSDLAIVTFDLAGFGEFRQLKNSSSQTQRATAGLYNFSLVFPTRKSAALALGISPVSAMGYEFSKSANVTLDSLSVPAQFTRKGSGSINEFYLGGSFQLLRHKLGIGATFGYLFGSVTEDYFSFMRYPDSPSPSSVGFQEQTKIRGFTSRIGIQYADTLKKDTATGKKLLLRVGLMTNLPITVNGDQLSGIRYPSASSPFVFPFPIRDTLVYSPSSSLNMPPAFSFGFALEGKDQLERQYFTWGIDAIYQDWSDFKLFSSSDQLQAQIRVATGAEIVPDHGSSKYLKKTAYRFGFYTERSYLKVNNTDLWSYGVSFGLGLPIPKSFSRINVTFEYVYRGTTNNGLIQENALRVVLGLSFTELWFMKHQYE